MRRRARGPGGLIVTGVAGALLVLVQPAAKAATAGSSPARPARPALPAHQAKNHSTVESTNWSGYVDRAPAGGHITSVIGHWVVPSAQSLPPGFSAAWTGIGGFGTTDLIQAGTTTNSLGGAQYYAWFELLPDAETPIAACSRDASCTVNPGDSIAVHIDSTGGEGWRIRIDDQGHWSWSANVTYRSTQSTAEWVLESPSVGAGPTMLANVGAVTFDDGNGYRADGLTRLVGQGDPIPIRLNTLGLLPVSEPSAIDADGDGFRVCSYGATCAPPNP